MKKYSQGLWCIEYDEESYHQSFKKINFSRYLKRILSSEYYLYFQKQIANQLEDESQWNKRCWVVIHFFQYLNEVFSSESMESNMFFVPENNLRKAFGTFQMWIDLERLYLFSFLKLDRIEFQEDRIYFTFFRTFMFMKAFLMEHQVTDFMEGYLSKISKNIKLHLKRISSNVPNYMHPLITDIGNIIDNFLKEERILIPENHEIQCKKIIYKKLIRLNEMIGEIQSRLQTNIAHQDGFRKQKYITEISKQKYFHKFTQNLEYLYDSNAYHFKIMKQKAAQNGQQFDEEKAKEFWAQFKRKQKQKSQSENPYQTLMRANHNPYEQSNYAIYGEILGIDMSKKKNLEEVKEEEAVEEKVQIDSSSFYKDEYLKKVLYLDKSYGKILKQDLKQDLKNKKSNEYFFSKKNEGKLSNLKWQKYGHPSKQQYLETAEVSKDITNNVLFKETEEREFEKKIQHIQIMTRGGLQSKALYELQKQSQVFYNQPSSDLMINLTQNCTQDRNEFDNLRKIAMYSSAQKKIYNLLNKAEIAKMYRRNIEEIREFHSDPQIKTFKIQTALAQI